jgi:hypothetical protein
MDGAKWEENYDETFQEIPAIDMDGEITGWYIECSRKVRKWVCENCGHIEDEELGCSEHYDCDFVLEKPKLESEEE